MDNDDWVEWEGGACPVGLESFVDVRMRDGWLSQGKHAKELCWRHRGGLSSEIVSYRIFIDPLDKIESEPKQERYQDATGEDWIDECARTLTTEEFRGAMKFTIGKYNRRCGKKDAILSEVEKIKDYATRWAQYERDTQT